MKYDAIVIGAGAAGLFCAIEAGKRGRKVLVIERNAQVGRKIIISGGGRCNFTNIYAKPENFISKNPHFCKSALAGYTPQNFIELVEKYKIEFYEKKLGQLFCRGSSRQIVEMLLRECEKAKVELKVNCSINRVSKNASFEIETNDGVFTSKNLIVASGGLSFPKIGATDLGYRIAGQFDLEIVEPRASLVPLIFAGKTAFKSLAGISIDSNISTGTSYFRENILFTHRGLSGPAILQISNFWERKKEVSINLLPEFDALEIFEQNRESRQQLGNFLCRFLPNRFVEMFISDQFSAKTIDQLNRKEIEKVAEKLNNWRVIFGGSEGYDKAEVTLGGVSTGELSSKTMESKKIPGLYFIGEVVDVTGWLGGYNFQWAWSSGFAAGKSI